LEAVRGLAPPAGLVRDIGLAVGEDGDVQESASEQVRPGRGHAWRGGVRRGCVRRSAVRLSCGAVPCSGVHRGAVVWRGLGRARRVVAE
jgi:hypothetical protein